VRVHGHDDRARRHDELRKRILRFRAKRLHPIVAHHLGQGRAFHLDADELLYRDAAVAKELGELGLVAKDERQTSPATPRASLGH
jgi:hypothetical protein